MTLTAKPSLGKPTSDYIPASANSSYEVLPTLILADELTRWHLMVQIFGFNTQEGDPIEFSTSSFSLA